MNKRGMSLDMERVLRKGPKVWSLAKVWDRGQSGLNMS